MAILDTVTDYELKALDRVSTLQQTAIDYLGRIVGALDSRLPDRPGLPFEDRLPTLAEVVDSQFTVSKKVLANQEKFAKNVVKTIKPLTAREAPRATKATAAKAAA